MITRRATLKWAAGVGLLSALALRATPAFAGSYLSRAALLLDGAELEARKLRARFFDKELARLTHRLALGRTKAAGEMLVPDEVKRAHPHLLLVMESYERAAEAAVRGEQSEFLVALERAREETTIFVAVLKQDGWELPK
jgi:hypothetical protein